MINTPFIDLADCLWSEIYFAWFMAKKWITIGRQWIQHSLKFVKYEEIFHQSK